MTSPPTVPLAVHWRWPSLSEPVAREACAELNRRFLAAGDGIRAEVGESDARGTEIILFGAPSTVPGAAGAPVAPPSQPLPTAEEVVARIAAEVQTPEPPSLARRSQVAPLGTRCDPL